MHLIIRYNSELCDVCWFWVSISTAPAPVVFRTSSTILLSSRYKSPIFVPSYPPYLKATIRWKLVSHPLPAWNIAPACNSPLQHYFLLRMRTSWTLNFGARAIEEICWVAEAVCCCKMLNFTVYNKTSRKTSVPWHIHAVNPPDLTFRGFYHQEGARFIEVVSGLHSRVPVGCY